MRWTNVNIGGSLCRLFFHYKKLADFCFFCGRLDHINKDCKESQLEGKKHYGPWLCGHRQHPIFLNEIAADIDSLNPNAKTILMINTPKTPSTNKTASPSPNMNHWMTPKTTYHSDKISHSFPKPVLQLSYSLQNLPKPDCPLFPSTEL